MWSQQFIPSLIPFHGCRPFYFSGALKESALIMAEHQLTEAGANGQTSLRVVAPVGEVYSTEQEHALIHREWYNRQLN